MVKLITTFTEEADLPDRALEEIKTQIDEKGGLLSNCVGIIYCHYDFAYGGIVKAISETMPFPVVGTTVSFEADSKFQSKIGMVFSILTSDDCDFLIENTPNNLCASTIVDESKALVRRFCDASKEKGFKTAKMGLLFSPFFKTTTVEIMLDEFTAALPQVPLFGTQAISDNADFSESYVINGSEYTESTAVIVFICGDFEPEFEMVSISHNLMLSTESHITKSHGNEIYEIDGKPAWDFIKEVGIARDETFENLIAQPLILSAPDGTVNMRNFIDFDIEKSILRMHGNIKTGSKVDFVLVTNEIVESSCRDIMKKLTPKLKGKSALIMSCASRLWALGNNQFNEINSIRETNPDLNFAFCYSGGELFPQLLGGKYINTLQNNDFIVCYF